MEQNDIIEVEGKEFLVYEKFSHHDNDYYILNLLKDEEMSEESIVVKLVDGLLCSIDDEDEKLEVQKILNQMLEESMKED